MDRIVGFDVARAFAISLVVLSHAHQGSQEIGIYGVELFFALSGFLIGSILHRSLPAEGRWNWTGAVNFWKRRWWRTLPAYYFFLVLAMAHHSWRGEMPEGGVPGLLSYLTFTPNLMSPNEMFFGVSWSLCVEEAFYLLFPLLLLLFHRVSESRRMAFGGALLVFLLTSVALREVSLAAWPAEQVRVMTLPRLDAIGFGVCMAVLTLERGFSLLERKGLALLGALLLTAVVAAHVLSRPIEGATVFFRVSLIAMPLAFSLFMPLLEEWRRLPAFAEWLRKPVTTISLWSYSIYLSHHMILMAIYPLFGELMEHFAVKLFSKVAGLVVVLVVSRWSYRQVESRFMAMRPPEIHATDPPTRRRRLTTTPLPSQS